MEDVSKNGASNEDHIPSIGHLATSFTYTIYIYIEKIEYIYILKKPSNSITDQFQLIEFILLLKKQLKCNSDETSTNFLLNS